MGFAIEDLRQSGMVAGHDGSPEGQVGAGAGLSMPRGCPGAARSGRKGRNLFRLSIVLSALR